MNRNKNLLHFNYISMFVPTSLRKKFCGEQLFFEIFYLNFTSLKIFTKNWRKQQEITKI